MADLQTLERAFMKAHTAGDTQAAAVLAAEIKRQRVTTQASAPPAQGQAPAAELSWSDVPGQALQNAPSSAAEFGKNLAYPFMHPIEAAKGLGNLAEGTFLHSTTLQGANAFLAKHGLAKKRDLAAEANSVPVKTAEAVGGMLRDRYGSEKGWKNSLATDPVGVAADLSALLSGGGALLARVPGRVASVSSRAMRMASEISNPINAVTKTVGLLGKASGQAVGLTTGAGAQSLQEAHRAGLLGGSAGQDFRASMRGKIPQEAVINDAKAALSKMATDRSAEYMKNMQAVKGATTHIDYAPIDSAMNDLVDSMYVSGTGLQKADTKTLAKLKEVGTVIDEWSKDPQGHTAIGLDGLKQRIDDMMPPLTESTKGQSRIITQMRNVVKNAIVKAAPEYANAMNKFESSISTQQEIEKALSLGRKASKDTGLRKLQSVMRNNANTNYGSRVDNVRKLEETGAAKNMTQKLAGQSLGSFAPRGLAKVATTMLLGGGMMNPALWAALPLASPRLAGEAAHLLGRVGKRVPKVPLAAYQAGKFGLLGNQ